VPSQEARARLVEVIRAPSSHLARLILQWRPSAGAVLHFNPASRGRPSTRLRLGAAVRCFSSLVMSWNEPLIGAETSCGCCVARKIIF
jgi:hypothetical protein